MCFSGSCNSPAISLQVLGYIALFGNTICMVRSSLKMCVMACTGCPLVFLPLSPPSHAGHLRVVAEEICVQQSWLQVEAVPCGSHCLQLFLWCIIHGIVHHLLCCFWTRRPIRNTTGFLVCNCVCSLHHVCSVLPPHYLVQSTSLLHHSHVFLALPGAEKDNLAQSPWPLPLQS